MFLEEDFVVDNIFDIFEEEEDDDMMEEIEDFDDVDEDLIDDDSELEEVISLLMMRMFEEILFLDYICKLYMVLEKFKF